MSEFTALYMPGTDRNDPSRGGFETEDAAWEWVYGRMCLACKEERRLALAGEKLHAHDGNDYECSEHPPCACEWEVVPTEEVNEW